MVLADAISMRKGQCGKTGTPSLAARREADALPAHEPQDLAAECPMPLSALAGPKAAVVGGTTVSSGLPAAHCAAVSDRGGYIWTMAGWQLEMGWLRKCQH